MSPVPNGSSPERSLVARTRGPTTSPSAKQADCAKSGTHHSGGTLLVSLRLRQPSTAADHPNAPGSAVSYR